MDHKEHKANLARYSKSSGHKVEYNEGPGSMTRPSEQANQEREEREEMIKGPTRYQFENAKRWGGRRIGK